MSSVKLVLEFDSLEALDKYLHPKDRPASLPAAIVQAATAPADSGKSAKPAKSTKPAPAAPASTPAAPSSITYEQVKAACLKLANKKGRDALLKVLTANKLANAQDAKPDQYKFLVDQLEMEVLA